MQKDARCHVPFPVVPNSRPLPSRLLNLKDLVDTTSVALVRVAAQADRSDRCQLTVPARSELTGFFPQIEIFPSETSKRYLKGWGLGFTAEILGVG